MQTKTLKLKQTRTPERDVQASVVQFLGMFGYDVHRMPLGPVLHRKGKGDAVRSFWKENPLKGFPDLFTFSRHRTGRMIAIECKAKGGKLRPEQSEWIARLEAHGAICVVGDDAAEIVAEVRRRDVNQTPQV